MSEVPRPQLPEREMAKSLLGKLPHFQGALLDALWDMEEVLPWDLLLFLRDWTAHAYFADSPVVQARLDAINKGTL